jgi:hypothetical protein
MNLDFTLGQMVECMMDFTKTIRSIIMAFIHGLTKRNMLVGGIMESSTDLVYLFQKKEKES